MSYSAQLWVFFALVFGAVILPGIDMAYILASALTAGRRHGFAAVAGVVAGAALHSVFAAAGVGLILIWWPWAFKLLLVAGAAFIGWIGLGILRSALAPAHVPGAAQADATAAQAQAAHTAAPRERPPHTFARAIANNLLNPNAYLFSLAIFPQFIRPERGAVALQAAVLWAIIAATQIGVYGTIVLAAAQVRQWLGNRPDAQRRVRLAVGVMLLAAGIVGGIAGWQHG